MEHIDALGETPKIMQDDRIKYSIGLYYEI